jgi:hypothetical protein
VKAGLLRFDGRIVLAFEELDAVAAPPSMTRDVTRGLTDAAGEAGWNTRPVVPDDEITSPDGTPDSYRGLASR